MRKVNFDVVKEDIGVYTIEIGDLSGQLQVVKPAEFKLSSLVVTPKEVEAGKEVTVTVDVTNTGGLEGNYTCTLSVGRGANVQESKEVTLDSEETKTITFTFTPSYTGGGSTNVQVGELTERIKTLRPADLEVSSVSISETIIEVGSSVTVTVSVRNWGDVEGTDTVALKIDGDSAGTQSISVSGGETGTARFTVTESDIGRHKITVDGKNTYFTVVPAAPPGYIGYTHWTFLGTFLGRQGGLFIVYPEGWQEMAVDEFEGFGFMGPIQSDGSIPSFNVVRVNLLDEMTVREYFESARAVYELLFEGYKEVSTKEITVNGVAAIKHTFTMTQFGLSLTMIQVILINNEMTYIITLGTTTTVYPDFVETFDTIINSFQLFP